MVLCGICVGLVRRVSMCPTLVTDVGDSVSTLVTCVVIAVLSDLGVISLLMSLTVSVLLVLIGCLCSNRLWVCVGLIVVISCVALVGSQMRLSPVGATVKCDCGAVTW